jgi:hypothetical protein
MSFSGRCHLEIIFPLVFVGAVDRIVDYIRSKWSINIVPLNYFNFTSSKDILIIILSLELSHLIKNTRILVRMISRFTLDKDIFSIVIVSTVMSDSFQIGKEKEHPNQADHIVSKYMPHSATDTSVLIELQRNVVLLLSTVLYPKKLVL